MKALFCPHCGTAMQYAAQKQIQLGETGWLLGDLPNLLAGSLTVDICICPTCRKLEFFAVEGDDLTEEAADEALPQKTCPACGAVHDFDYPKCPQCKYDYYAEV